MLATMTALIVCMRFSASSNWRAWRDSKTSSVTSLPFDRGEAVEEYNIVVSGRFDEFLVYLIRQEQRPCALRLSPLRPSTPIRPVYYRVGAFDRGLRVVGDGYRRAGLTVLSYLLALGDERRVGEEFFRRADDEVHSHLRRADHKGVGDVVASVSDVDEADALEASEVLANREEVGEGPVSGDSRR